MTPEDATKNLQARVAGEFSIQGKDDCADIKLGIETLKYYQEMKRLGNIPHHFLLPGETEK